MNIEKVPVSSGVDRLDSLLGNIYIGDNVVWYDDAGSLATVFCLNLMRISQRENKPLVYVSFDRSPKNLLDKLGSLAKNPNLTILDCFTDGKGESADVFRRFYESSGDRITCNLVRVQHPEKPEELAESLEAAYAAFGGNDVRFIIESITGMQDLWGGEDHVLRFYTHSCPRLYELNTVAYWIIEKKAHSQRLRAGINQIAQVAMELTLKRGKTFLSILKAEGREIETLNRPYNYAVRGLDVVMEGKRQPSVYNDIGAQLKEYRISRGFSQTELARLVGVTPSTISQVEGGQILPSLPALLKMAETLSVDVASFFQGQLPSQEKVVYSSDSRVQVNADNTSRDQVMVQLLAPGAISTAVVSYLVEIPEDTEVAGHFFYHKGEEMGYVLDGEVLLKTDGGVFCAGTGDLIHLRTDAPQWWKTQPGVSLRMLWLKIKGGL